MNRLVPAANASALAAAVAHVVSLALISGSIEIESTIIAFMTYVIAFIVVLPFGAALLAVVGFFRIGLVFSLVLFQVTALLVIVVLAMLLFELELAEVPWQYAYVSVPAALTAWYFSVYHSCRNNRDILDT